MSGMLIVSAPASIAAERISYRNVLSERAASSGEKSTRSQSDFASFTASTACFVTSAGVIFSLCSMCIGDVAMKVWILGFLAFLIASAVALMSFSFARASPQISGFVKASAISFTDVKSSGDAIGNPASITSTPSFSNWRARRIFSSIFIE